MVGETLLLLREKVTRLTEEVNDLRRRNAAFETARPPSDPVRQEEAIAPNPSANPQLHALPPLDENLLFADVTQSALQAAWIPLLASRKREGQRDPSTDARIAPHPPLSSSRDKKVKAESPRPKSSYENRPVPQNYSGSSGGSPPSASDTDSDLDSEAEAFTVAQPTFGPKAKGVTVWKPTNHRFRGACNYRAYRLVNTDSTVDAKVYATTHKRVQYLLVVMGEYKFSRSDRIKVISFLARCKENFDKRRNVGGNGPHGAAASPQPAGQGGV